MMFRPLRRSGWVALLLACPLACSTERGERTAHNKSRLVVDPDPVSLGFLRPGEQGHVTFTVRNPESNLMVVDEVKSSCPCVSVSNLPARIDPGGSARFVVSFDPAEEPDFRGGLSVELIGMGPDRAVLFRTQVKLRISGTPDTVPEDRD